MKKRILCILLSTSLLFVGCSKNDDNSSKETSITTASTTTEAETTTTPEENPDLILPLTENTSGKVQIQTCSDNPLHPLYSYMITSSNGETIIVDPSVMPRKSKVDLNPSLIISTRDCAYHLDETFNDDYDCPTVLYTIEDMNTEDFHIYTFQSAAQSDEMSDIVSNVIIVMEVDGLRIAYIGVIGQSALTEEQLEKLGDIDIAFMPIEDSWAHMSLKNENGFNIIEQFNPKIVIPVSFTDKANPVIEEKYGEITTFENVLQISKEDIPETPFNFYHITNDHKYM